ALPISLRAVTRQAPGSRCAAPSAYAQQAGSWSFGSVGPIQVARNGAGTSSLGSVELRQLESGSFHACKPELPEKLA
ncbi:MAG: hypothetical protein KDI66_20340, partial [Xanthomonadales bacterium]|nr:hypothetical protein [Xanthomonadales bacterium]